MNTEIQTVGDKELATVHPMLVRARELGIEIVNDEHYTAAGELLALVKKARKNIESVLRPFVDSSHKKWKDDLAELNKYDKPLAEAIEILNKPLADYDRKKEAERLAEERQLEAEEKKRAEDEALAYAEQLEKDGHAEAAEEVIAQPIITAPVIVPKTMPKVNGMSFTDYYSAEVVDLMALVKDVAAGKAPLASLSPAMTFLNSQARALRKEMHYAGVVVKCERKPTNRG